MEKLSMVISFVDEQLEAVGCPKKILKQMNLAVEEIFVNIASYAYPTGTGNVVVRVETLPDHPSVDIAFIDNGITYDPRAKEDPDIDLDIDEREIGGLGIFMTKQYMDDLKYEYIDGHNILTLKKGLRIK